MSLTSTDKGKAETHTWLTPIALIHSLGEFDLDPCGYPGHPTARQLITLPEDGLITNWCGRVWLNPPYGEHAKLWLDKLSSHGNGIALVFARLETKWLRPHLRNGFFVLSKRINFESPVTGKGGNAGSASILIPYGRKNIGAILSSDLDGEWYQ